MEITLKLKSYLKLKFVLKLKEIPFSKAVTEEKKNTVIIQVDSANRFQHSGQREAEARTMREMVADLGRK